MDWESMFKRYVWDHRTTPYLIRVEKLNRRQADNEILAYCLFVGVLFAVIALGALSEASPYGRSPIMALYGFTVVCATVLLNFTKSVPAALFLAAMPLVSLVFLYFFGAEANHETVDTVIVAGIALLLLWYSVRLVNLTRVYPRLPEAGKDDSPRRRLFK